LSQHWQHIGNTLACLRWPNVIPVLGQAGGPPAIDGPTLT